MLFWMCLASCVVVHGQFQPIDTIIPGTYATDIQLMDLNGDGLDDLITLHGNPAIMKWSPNIMGDASNWLNLELPFETIGLTDFSQPLSGGTPSGGTYTLAGSTDTITSFDPLIAGLGTHHIVYTYTDPFTGCIGSDTATVVVELSTSISASATGARFSIFPNPAGQEVSITFVPTSNDRILIHDAVGRLVETRSVQHSPLQIVTSGFAPGTYTITLEQEGRRQHAVLVVE